MAVGFPERQGVKVIKARTGKAVNRVIKSQDRHVVAANGVRPEIGVFAVPVAADKNLVIHAAQRVGIGCRGGEGQAVGFALLVPELAQRAIHHAVIIGVDKSARFVILLTFKRVEIAHANFGRDAFCRFGLETCLIHRGLEVEEVGLFIRIPTDVGQEIAFVIGWHTAQPCALHVLVIVCDLCDEARIVAHLEGQACVKDQRLVFGVIAERVHSFIKCPHATQDGARPVERARHLTRGTVAVIVARCHCGLCRQLVCRCFGDIIDQPAGFTGAIEHARRALEHFNTFDVEKLGDGESDERVAAQAVIKNLILTEATEGHARIAELGDARDVAVEVGHVARALVGDQRFIDDADSLRDVHRVTCTARHTGFCHTVQRLRAAGDDNLFNRVVGFCGTGRLRLRRKRQSGSKKRGCTGKAQEGAG